jgi:hypothetical protein
MLHITNSSSAPGTPRLMSASSWLDFSWLQRGRVLVSMPQITTLFAIFYLLICYVSLFGGVFILFAANLTSVFANFD